MSDIHLCHPHLTVSPSIGLLSTCHARHIFCTFCSRSGSASKVCNQMCKVERDCTIQAARQNLRRTTIGQIWHKCLRIWNNMKAMGKCKHSMHTFNICLRIYDICAYECIQHNRFTHMYTSPYRYECTFTYLYCYSPFFWRLQVLMFV